MRRALLTLALLALALPACSAAPAPDPERLRAAKALFFDRKYAEAREAWVSIATAATGADAETAAFWIARCSENLSEHERALKEFGAFLDRHPKDTALAEEARTDRVGLAVRLYKAGRTSYIPLVTDALADPSKTVRYYAALQLGGLGPGVGTPAVPVLKKILSEEQDPDLVDRAKLILLRLDPAALGPGEPGNREGPDRPGGHHEVSWVKVRIFEKGQTKPEVSVNLPVALAELLFKSLPDGARKELRKKGYEPDNFWDKLKKAGPTQILDIQGDDGERIQIWLE